MAVIVILATTLSMNNLQEQTQTWMNGDYKVDINFAIVHVDNDNVTYRQLKFLDSEDFAYQPCLGQKVTQKMKL